jgi:hypothetical protein
LRKQFEAFAAKILVALQISTRDERGREHKIGLGSLNGETQELSKVCAGLLPTTTTGKEFGPAPQQWGALRILLERGGEHFVQG